MKTTNKNTKKPEENRLKLKNFKPYYYGVRVRPAKPTKNTSSAPDVSYSFHSLDDVDNWLETEFVQLKKKYNNLVYNIFDLPGLKIGQKCHVNGDGPAVYKIIDVDESMKNRPLFILDDGFMEEVQNCYAV